MLSPALVDIYPPGRKTEKNIEVQALVHQPHDTRSESHLQIALITLNNLPLYIISPLVRSPEYRSDNAVLAKNCRSGENNTDVVMASAARSAAIVQISQDPIIAIVDVI